MKMKNKNDGLIREQVDRLGRPSIEMLEREIERLERKESLRQVGKGLLINLVTATAVIIIVTNLWLTILHVEGSSMNPLLHDDEIVLAFVNDDPGKSDVIVFYKNNELYIKRVIATAEDNVEIDRDGVVYINGEVFYEPYVAELSLGSSDIEFPYTVPAGTVFVLGDNRGISSDSRDSRFGPVDVDQIVGEVAFVIWPLSQLGKVA